MLESILWKKIHIIPSGSLMSNFGVCILACLFYVSYVHFSLLNRSMQKLISDYYFRIQYRISDLQKKIGQICTNKSFCIVVFDDNVCYKVTQCNLVLI